MIDVQLAAKRGGRTPATNRAEKAVPLQNEVSEGKGYISTIFRLETATLWDAFR